MNEDKAEKQQSFLQGKSPVLGMKDQERGKKIPHLTRNSRGIDGGVGMKKLSIEYGLPINFLL
jgi:hypothetical protein